MSTWAPGGFALGGIALGWALTTLTERGRRRHAAKVHWLDLRRDLAVKFLEATEDLDKWTLGFSNLAASIDSGGPLLSVEGVTDLNEVLRRKAEADRRVYALRTEIELVGTREERDAARALWKAVSDVGVAYADYLRSPSGEDKDAAQARHQDAVAERVVRRLEFMSVVRSGLVDE